MKTSQHLAHITERVAHNDCQECRADNERRFVPQGWQGYQYVSEYLAYIRPRLLALASGNDTLNARQWKRDFILALHRRITLRTGRPQGRKQSVHYLDRLAQFRSRQDGQFLANASYLRDFARRGADTLR